MVDPGKHVVAVAALFVGYGAISEAFAALQVPKGGCNRSCSDVESETNAFAGAECVVVASDFERADAVDAVVALSRPGSSER